MQLNIKRIIGNSYVLGVLFSMLSIGVSLLINVILYPIYWKILSASDFQSWFSIFEFSLLFLLLDVGFSQNFIKNNVGGETSVFEKNYQILRGTLLLVSVFAFLIQLPIFLYLRQPANVSQFIPYCLLALSTALTLWAYSETAALRVLLKFNAVASISIAGNIAFLVVVFYFKEHGVYAISCGVLLRALVVSILQVSILSKVIRIKTILSFEFEGAATNVLMNFSYLSIFAFDAVVFSKAGLKVADVASYMLNRKLYDLVRGFFDAAMNVISVKLVKQKLSDHFVIVLTTLTLIFGTVYLIAPFVYRYAIGSSAFDSQLSLNLAFCGMFAAMIRFCQLSFYMTNHSNQIIALFVGMASLKILFFISLFLAHSDIRTFYLLQNVLMALLVAFIYWRYSKHVIPI